MNTFQQSAVYGGARSRPSISAVMPAYNEAEGIADAVRQLATMLAGLTDDYEVIVTNDGSRDATGAVLAALQQQQPTLPLRVVTHATNQGYGAALASGFDAAAKELIFMTDGDKQFDGVQPEDVRGFRCRRDRA